MADALLVALEAGPRGKRVVAVARDWPGLSRGGTTEERAIANLLSYVPRYARIAERAGETVSGGAPEVVERYTGTGSTDFWGISFAFSEFDRQPLTSSEVERELALMRACWAEFDDIRARVSAEMRKGPRGGGRERDHIVRHTISVEYDWRRQLGLAVGDEAPLAAEALREHRESYVAALRGHAAEGRSAGKSPIRYLIRHTAFHTMDHAWEMEDKDLSSA